MTKKISLRNRVRDIVNKYDPITLLESGCPIDEYDPEVKKIIPLFQIVKSIDQLQDLIYEIFVSMFDEKIAGPKNKYRKLSEELFALLQYKQ